jgi:hypothetical protein
LPGLFDGGLYLAAAVAMLGALGSLVAAAYFYKSLLIPGAIPDAEPVLILPVTGAVPGLEPLLHALAAQTLRPKRLIIAVESAHDPAYRRVAALGSSYAGFALDLVVADGSSSRGQKCTNLLAGLTRLHEADRYVVFLDADICPQAWWLAGLIEPLAGGRADIVNGYIWPLAERPSVFAVAVATIGRAAALLPRFGRLRLLSGAGIGVTRAAIEALDLPATLAHQLSDDLAIADRAGILGLRVITRRGLRAPTRLRAEVAPLWGFGRRQYQLLHLYRPRLWLSALLAVTADFAARLAIVVTSIAAIGPYRAALLGWTVIALLSCATARLRHAIGNRLGVRDAIGVRTLEYLLACTALPIAAIHCALIWRSLVASRFDWAHLSYTLDRTGRVLSVRRRPYPAA